jgi:hypothetical protein
VSWRRGARDAKFSGGGDVVVDLTTDEGAAGGLQEGVHAQDAGVLAWRHWRDTDVQAGRRWRRCDVSLFNGEERVAVERMSAYGAEHGQETWLRARYRWEGGWQRNEQGRRTVLLPTEDGELALGNEVEIGDHADGRQGVIRRVLNGHYTIRVTGTTTDVEAHRSQLSRIKRGSLDYDDLKSLRPDGDITASVVQAYCQLMQLAAGTTALFLHAQSAHMHMRNGSSDRMMHGYARVLQRQGSNLVLVPWHLPGHWTYAVEKNFRCPGRAHA